MSSDENFIYYFVVLENDYRVRRSLERSKTIFQKSQYFVTYPKNQVVLGTFEIQKNTIPGLPDRDKHTFSGVASLICEI